MRILPLSYLEFVGERSHFLNTERFLTLLSILCDSGPDKADGILKATDIKGVPFLDVLIDCEQKNVIADAAVQKYLSDVWVSCRPPCFLIKH